MTGTQFCWSLTSMLFPSCLSKVHDTRKSQCPFPYKDLVKKLEKENRGNSQWQDSMTSGGVPSSPDVLKEFITTYWVFLHLFSIFALIVFWLCSPSLLWLWLIFNPPRKFCHISLPGSIFPLSFYLWGQVWCSGHILFILEPWSHPTSHWYCPFYF